MKSVVNCDIALALRHKQALQKALLKVREGQTRDEAMLREEQLVTEADLVRAKEVVGLLLNKPTPWPAAQQWRAPSDLPKYTEGAVIKEFIRRYETVLASEGFPVEKWLDLLPRQNVDIARLKMEE